MLIATVTVASAQFSVGVKAGYNRPYYDLSVKGVSLNADLGALNSFYGGLVGDWKFSENCGLQFEVLYSWDGMGLAIGKKFGERLLDSEIFGAILTDLPIPVDLEQKYSLNMNMHNIRIPIMFKFQPVGGLSVQAGGYVSYRVATSVKLNKNLKDLGETLWPMTGLDASLDDITDYAGEIVNDNLKKLDAGLVFGMEYKFPCGFFIDGRYSMSLMNSMKSDFMLPANDKLGIPEVTGSWEDLIGANIQPKAKYSSFQLGIGYMF